MGKTENDLLIEVATGETKAMLLEFFSSETLHNSPLITGYMHCRECIRERPDGVSPAQWSRISAGLTAKGFQIWCMRHGINIVHMGVRDGRLVPIPE